MQHDPDNVIKKELNHLVLSPLLSGSICGPKVVGVQWYRAKVTKGFHGKHVLLLEGVNLIANCTDDELARWHLSIAERFGYVPPTENDRLKEELRRAAAAGDWNAVKTIAARLESVKFCEKPEASPNSDFTESPEAIGESSFKSYTRQGSNL